MPFDHVIGTPSELYELYEQPDEGVRTKAVAAFDTHCRAYIALSPFVLVATTDAEGRCDVSPRGGAPGIVTIIDDSRLVIADASGNNRLDTLRNVTETGQIGLLFLIPGMAETLRVNGRASITNDPELLAQQEMGRGKPPKAVIGVDLSEAFLHCAKAFMRSQVWDPAAWPDRSGLARPAQIWKDHIGMREPLEDVETWLADDYANNL
jgi:PPOX class probable FMN-dependent enzyme, DR_2398 family